MRQMPDPANVLPAHTSRRRRLLRPPLTAACRGVMLSGMRTTIRIDDALLAELKAQAARSGRTLTAVIEDALRAELARRADRRATPSPELPVSRGGRLQPGVDLDDNAALLDLMEGDVR